MTWEKFVSKKVFILSGIGVLLFFGFVFFTSLIHRDRFTQIDFDTTVRLQDQIPRSFDDEFSFLSEVGKFEASTLALAALIIFYFVTKPRHGSWIRKSLFGITVVSSYIGFHLIELYGKLRLIHPPPPQFMLRTEHLFDFPQFHIRSEFSYPSGHAGRAAFLSVILIILIYRSPKLPRLVKLLMVGGVVGYDILMWVSRVYLGEHWTSDVIGGMLLGASLGALSGSLLLYRQESPKFKIKAKSN